MVMASQALEDPSTLVKFFLDYIKRLHDFLMKQRIASAFFLAGVFLAVAEPTMPSLWIGMAVVLLGEALRVWASGYIHKGKKLARNGPYAHMRHPLYTGNFLLGLGMCIMGASIPFLLLYVVMFVAVYLGIARSEERKMEETFGTEYAVYKNNVPVFIPRVRGWAIPGSVPEKFHFERVMRNREYNAWMGIAAVALILYGKFLVLP